MRKLKDNQEKNIQEVAKTQTDGHLVCCEITERSEVSELSLESRGTVVNGENRRGLHRGGGQEQRQSSGKFCFSFGKQCLCRVSEQSANSVKTT